MTPIFLEKLVIDLLTESLPDFLADCETPECKSKQEHFDPFYDRISFTVYVLPREYAKERYT